VFAGGAKLGAKEQSYVSAVKKLNEDNAAHPGRLSTDPITLMTAACEPFENKTMATTMSACWRLLGDIMSDARARGLNPSSDPAVYIESLIKVSTALCFFRHAVCCATRPQLTGMPCAFHSKLNCLPANSVRALLWVVECR
jgi:hypothetical protein